MNRGGGFGERLESWGMEFLETRDSRAGFGGASSEMPNLTEGSRGAR